MEFISAPTCRSEGTTYQRKTLISWIVSISSLLSLFLGVSTASAQTGAPFPGATRVGVSATSQTVRVTASKTGTISSLNVVTQGAAALDFRDAGNGTCAVGVVLSVGNSCTVNVTFTPQAPGARAGAIMLRASDGTVLGRSFLVGTGVGAIAMMVPGTILTAVGNGSWIFRSDGTSPSDSTLFLPTSTATDAAGNIYIADSADNRVRRVSITTGLISTIAGTGEPGFSGDGGPAVNAMLNSPTSVVVDGAGNVIVADSQNHVVRAIDGTTGIIRTVAGQPGQMGNSGDTHAAISAKLNVPEGIALDGAGNLYIADTGNNTVRMVVDASGVINTIAGTGSAGFSGDGALATSAQLSAPWGVALDPNGNLYVADANNNRVRMIATTGVISSVAGTGSAAFRGDGALASAAALNTPTAVAIDVAGNLYVADSGNNRVRKINVASGNITTFAGSGEASASGDGGPATAAGLYGPYGISINSRGEVLVADMFHNRVRLVQSGSVDLQFVPMRVGRTSAPKTESLENVGNRTLNLTNYNLANAALDAPTTTCHAGLAVDVGKSCDFGAEFNPQVIGDPVTGSIEINSDAVNVPTQIRLQGTVLTLDPTVTVIASDLNPAPLGAKVTFTVNVSGSGTKATGLVRILDGSILLGTATLDTNATGTLSLATLALGQHTITAAYAGDVSNNPSVSVALVQIIKQPSSTVLSLSSSQITSQATLVLTARVTTASPAGDTVKFTDDGNPLGSAILDSTGTATLTVSKLSVGTHVLQANFLGDNSTMASSSSSLNEIVEQDSSTTLLSSSSTNASAGAPVTFTVSVMTGSGAMAIGVAKFYEGTVLLGTATLDARASAVLTLTTLSVGAHTIVAQYSGNTEFSPSTSSPLIETIGQVETTTTLTSSVMPSDAGAAVQFTANVSWHGTTGGPLSGTVTFKEGSNVLGVGPVDSAGVAICTTTALLTGTHAIDASYSGNTNYAPSVSQNFSQRVKQATTSVTIAVTANPAIVGKPVTFTVTVTGTGITPTGAVSFDDGGQPMGQATLNSHGVVSLTSQNLSLGTHSISASYLGDVDNTASVSSPLSLVVQKATTNTNVTTAANPTFSGTPLLLTAAVSSNGNLPTGAVAFKDGSLVLATVGLDSQGGAKFSATLTTGSHSLSANYLGDVNNATSSGAVTEVVQSSQTTTTLASTPNPAAQGEIVSVTALVNSAGATPTGLVTFHDGTAILGTEPLNNGGLAVWSSSTLSKGRHTLMAQYAGDTNNVASTSSVVVQVIAPITTTVLSSNINPSIAGTPVIFNVVVSGSSLTPTGIVSIRDGGVIVGTTTLNGAASASLTLASLAPGVHNFGAEYGGDANNAGGSSPALQQTVQRAVTQSQLNAPVTSAIVGTSLAFNIAVTGNGATPSGNVLLVEGTATVGNAALNSAGTAVVNLPSLGVGQHVLSAVYGGDANQVGSTSPPVTVVLRQGLPTLSIASSSNPAAAGASIVFTATLSGAALSPTGTVTWQDGAVVLGTSQVSGSSQSSFVTSALSVGDHTVKAVYSGDVNNNAATSAGVIEAVTFSSTTVRLATSPNPSIFGGAAIALTATVSPAGNPVTGTINFLDGANLLGSAALNSSGVASLSTATLAIGDHILTAVYSGDSSHASSNSATLTQHVLQPTSTAVTAGSNPSLGGALLKFTVRVTGSNGVPSTGTVTLKDGVATIGAASVDTTGTAIISTATLTVGSHAITAIYAGDNLNQTSTSLIWNQVVQTSTTNVAVVASSNSAAVGTPISFSVKVTGHAVMPTGMVTLMDGPTALQTLPVDNSGSVAFTSSSLLAGAHQVAANYGGDGDNQPAASVWITIGVKRPTTVVTTSAQSPTFASDSVQLTAIVSDGKGGHPTGTVIFKDGAATIGSAALDITGTATLDSGALTVGSHGILASYSGDPLDFGSDSSSLIQVVQLRPTSTTLSASAASVGIGQPVTLIAVVNHSGPRSAGGTVTFNGPNGPVGTATVNGVDVASLTFTRGATGVSTYSAVFSGDANYATSSSNAVSVTVVLATNTPFSMTLNPSSVTVKSKQYQVAQLTLTASSSFSDVVNLGCAGLPFAATCTFQNDKVKLSGGSQQQVNVTIDTGNPLGAGGVAQSTHNASRMVTVCALPGIAMLAFLPMSKGRKLAGLLIGLIALSGCAGLQINGTPPGTYTFQITGVAVGSGVTQSTTVTMTVQP